jgi:hypothetical protein
VKGRYRALVHGGATYVPVEHLAKLFTVNNLWVYERDSSRVADAVTPPSRCTRWRADAGFVTLASSEARRGEME